MRLALQGIVRTRPELALPDMQMQVTTASYIARLWHPLWCKGAGHFLSLGEASTSIPRIADPSLCGRPTLGIRRALFTTISQASATGASSDASSRPCAPSSARSLLGEGLLPGRALADGDAEAMDAFVRQMVTTTGHPTGSCAMGGGPDAVLDSELRARGAEGLRVVDTCAFHVIMHGNTNAPTIMLAEKAADIILAGRRSQRRRFKEERA
jgi:hypothetical protein